MIGGRKVSIGTALIQITFKALHLVIDVDFLLLSEEVPILFSMRDMFQNGFEISIQRAQVMHGQRTQRLKI